MKEINYRLVHEKENSRNIYENERGKYDLNLVSYVQERFLYRLSISVYRKNFLLKGNHFLYAMRKSNQKIIDKIDLLGTHISNDKQSIKEAFEKICSEACEKDGVEFDGNRIIAEECNRVISVQIPATYKAKKEIIQLNISFGDSVIPKPQKIQYPVLSNMQAPVIWAYSTESMVAEKFEEIQSSSIVKNNLKTFYDMHVLLETQDFDGRILLEAVFETFQRRGTIIEKEQPLFTRAFVEDEERAEQWRSLRSNSEKEVLEFGEVMQQIGNFLTPIYQSILEENEYFKTWNRKTQTWR